MLQCNLFTIAFCALVAPYLEMDKWAFITNVATELQATDLE